MKKTLILVVTFLTILSAETVIGIKTSFNPVGYFYSSSPTSFYYNDGVSTLGLRFQTSSKFSFDIDLGLGVVSRDDGTTTDSSYSNSSNFLRVISFVSMLKGNFALIQKEKFSLLGSLGYQLRVNNSFAKNYSSFTDSLIERYDDKIEYTQMNHGFSLGISPVYSFNKHFSVFTDLGFMMLLLPENKEIDRNKSNPETGDYTLIGKEDSGITFGTYAFNIGLIFNINPRD